MRNLMYAGVFLVAGCCLVGCQTGNQVRALASTTSTNATTVSTNMTAFTQTQDRVYEFLDGNLQRAANEYNLQPNKISFEASALDASGQTNLAAVIRSLYRESETNALLAFNAQALLRQADASAIAQLQQRQTLISAWNNLAKDLAQLAQKPGLKDQAEFIAGYAADVYNLVQEKQKEANAKTTNAVQKAGSSK